MKNYLILNFNVQSNTLTVQINRRDSDGKCYNINFVNHTSYLVIDGFIVPTLIGNLTMPITGNSDTRTMVHCLKVLPKVIENKLDILEFLSDIIKREKLNMYQINVNGNMDYSLAKPINSLTVTNIFKEFVRFNWSVCF